MAVNLVNSLYNSLSGLRTTQTLLDTTTRNITNAQTANYVVERQHTEVAPDTGGAKAGAIQRIVDESLLARQRLTGSQLAYQKTRQNVLQQISALSGAPSDNSSIASQVSNLGIAFSALSSNPNDPGTALSVLNTAQQLAYTLNDQTVQLNNMRSYAQKSLQDDIAGVNNQLQIIADLNIRILANKSQNIDPSELQDQRDAVAADLAKKMEIRTFYDSVGSLNVYSGNYQTLVGKYATVISYDPATNVISTPTASLDNVGGEMGAFQAIYDTDAPQYLQQLDAFARTLTTSLYNLSSPIRAAVTTGSNVVDVPNASILRVGQAIKDASFPADAVIGAINGTQVTIVHSGAVAFSPASAATGKIPNLTAAQLAAAGAAANATQNAAQLYVSTPMPLFTPDPATMPITGASAVPPYYSAGIQVNQQLFTSPGYASVLKMGTTGAAPGVTTFGSTATENDAMAAVGAFNLLTLASPPNNAINFNPVVGSITPIIGATTNFQDAATALSVTAGQNANTATNLIAQLQTLGSQIEQSLSATSGVNIDSEMSNLIVLQNAYGANAQVTQTTQRMLDMLLGIVQ